MRRYTFAVGDSGPALTGEFPYDLTGATDLQCTLVDLAGGPPPFSPFPATLVSASAARSRVKADLPGPWPSVGEFFGYFTATLGGAQVRSPAFVVAVIDPAHPAPAPGQHPFVYGDGRGGYATVEDVLAMDLRREARVRVDTELVETILGDTAVELDTALRNYYAVPITRAQPEGWATVRLIHKYWALAEIYNLLAPASGNIDGYFAAAEVYREKATQLLDDITEGSTRLPDVPTAGEAAAYPESMGATITPDLDSEVDRRNMPIFSVNSMRRLWRLE
jgi:hypothetical protein